MGRTFGIFSRLLVCVPRRRTRNRCAQVPEKQRERAYTAFATPPRSSPGASTSAPDILQCWLPIVSYLQIWLMARGGGLVNVINRIKRNVVLEHYMLMMSCPLLEPWSQCFEKMGCLKSHWSNSRVSPGPTRGGVKKSGVGEAVKVQVHLLAQGWTIPTGRMDCPSTRDAERACPSREARNLNCCKSSWSRDLRLVEGTFSECLRCNREVQGCTLRVLRSVAWWRWTLSLVFGQDGALEIPPVQGMDWGATEVSQVPPSVWWRHNYSHNSLGQQFANNCREMRKRWLHQVDGECWPT